MDLTNLRKSIEAIKSKDLTDETKDEIVDSIAGIVDMISELSTAIEHINKLNAKLVQSAEVHAEWLKANDKKILNNLKLIKNIK